MCMTSPGQPRPLHLRFIKEATRQLLSDIQLIALLLCFAVMPPWGWAERATLQSGEPAFLIRGAAAHSPVLLHGDNPTQSFIRGLRKGGL